MSSKKALITKTSTPSYHEFNPKYIPWQYRLWCDVKNKYDFSTGVHYILMSGSVGSAKSLEGAALAISHCVDNPGARCCLGRKALPDLKDTIFTKILEMLHGTYIEKVDYWVRHENGYIKFANGSEIISRSWSDRKFKKFRSLELSMLLIEEATENDKRDWEFFEEAIARVERLPHIEENLVVLMTNPDDPAHTCYEFFIEGSTKTGKYTAEKADDDGHVNIHTYYSLTEQNPFLKKSYIRGLRKRYDARMIRRMLLGEWLFISTDVIYHEYDPEIHVVKKSLLKIDKELPLRLCFDFNIAKGKNKLMSSCLMQFYAKARNKTINSTRFKFYDEVGVQGARTLDACEEWAGKGYFDLPHNPEIIIHGDATGRSGTSKSIDSDYSIIENFLANYVRKDKIPLQYEIEVPSINPPIRNRHNINNGQLKNADGEIGIVIADNCTLVKKGYQQTRLKEGAVYIEDQSTEGQDMSNAASYGVHYCVEYEMEDEEDIEFS